MGVQGVDPSNVFVLGGEEKSVTKDMSTGEVVSTKYEYTFKNPRGERLVLASLRRLGLERSEAKAIAYFPAENESAQ